MLKTHESVQIVPASALLFSIKIIAVKHSVPGIQTEIYFIYSFKARLSKVRLLTVSLKSKKPNSY